MTMDKKNKDLIKSFANVGVDEVPTRPAKRLAKEGEKQSTVDKAMDILHKHQQNMQTEGDTIIMEHAANEWLVASFTRGQYYKVIRHPEDKELGIKENWECLTTTGMCPAKQFYAGDCKHIMAIKFSLEQGVKIPTEEEEMAADMGGGNESSTTA